MYEIPMQKVLKQLSIASEYRKYAPIKINGQIVCALIDSGNTGFNVISPELARKLKLTVRPINLKQVSTAQKGASMEIVGICKPFCISFAGHGTKFKTNPLVVRDLNMSFNMSGPFLASNHIDQLHSKGALSIHGKLFPLISNTDYEKHLSQTSINCLQTPFKERSTVFLAEDTTILPGTMKYVSVRISEIEQLKFELGRKEGLIVPDPRFEEKYDIHPARRVLVKVNRDNLSHTVLFNSSEEPIHLSRGIKFGSFTPVYSSLSLNYLANPFALATIENLNEAELSEAFSNDNGGNDNAFSNDNGENDNGVGDNGESNDLSMQAKKAWIKRNFKLKEKPLLHGNRLEKATSLLAQFYELFAVNDQPGHTDLIEHEINLKEGTKPIRVNQRPFNPILAKQLRKQVDVWLGSGVVEPSQSPWKFPLIPIKKKGSMEIRWCCDYRRLNEVTIADAYSIPDVNTNLSLLAQSRFFSTIDTVAAFHHISIRKCDREYTAFQAPQGFFHFKRMPFGLTNAPSTFSRLIAKALHEIPTDYCLIFLDDVLVHSRTFEEHLSHLQSVLHAHLKAGLRIKPSKCDFFSNEVKYLGHLVTADGVKVIPEYINVIQEWPVPTTVSEVRAFMGKAGYYRRFVKKFAEIASPLTDLLKDKRKGDKVEFTPEAVAAFETLKEKLITAPILAFPCFDSSSPFILDTDYSSDGMAAVLSQVQEGSERPILYASRKCTKGEKHYPSYKGELAAGITYMQQLRFYLLPKEFIWRTDNRSLNWIKTLKEPSGLVLRWLDTLANFHFQVDHRPGSKHTNADVLSRIAHSREATPEEEALSAEEAKLELCPLRILPEVDLKKAQEEDDTLSEVRRWVQTNQKPSREDVRAMPRDLQVYASLFETLAITEQGILIREAQRGEAFTDNRYCLPKSVQRNAVQLAHQHTGLNTTAEKVLRHYFFPGAYRVITEVVQGCPQCSVKWGQPKLQKDKLHSVIDGFPWARISIDFCGPLPPSTYGNTYILTIKDTYSRWLEAIPTTRTDAKNVARILEREIFARWGLPLQVHADRGSQFTSGMMAQIYKELDMRETHTPAYSPKSNPVERVHADLWRLLRAFGREDEWEENLPSVLMAIRSSRNRMTGVSPYRVLFGHDPMTPVEIVYGRPPQEVRGPVEHANQLRDRLSEAYKNIRQHLKVSYDRARRVYSGREKRYPAQSQVWLFTPVKTNKKLNSGWSGPWLVLRQVSDVLVEIQSMAWNKQKITMVVPIDRLKEYQAQGSPTKRDLRAEDLLTMDEFVELGATEEDELRRRHQIRVEHPRDYDLILDEYEVEPEDPPQREPGTSDDPPRGTKRTGGFFSAIRNKLIRRR